MNGLMWKPARGGRALLAIFLMVWTAVQPIVATAAGIVAANGGGGAQTVVDAAGNGVPLVNITTPNGAGVSHNRYEAFSVDARGAILNNAGVTTLTQLGGYVEGNPNLGGGSASLILNEVVGDTRSLLAGYLEVGGVPAEVVLANPNGITCNGCGFINTTRATLTTGTPLLDGGGNLAGFRLGGGDITVGGDGVNADNVDVFELLSRAVLLQADVYGDELSVTTGVGEFTRGGDLVEATPAASAPAFAIDSTALGGIHANRIRMIANEDGVGVRIRAPVAAQTGRLALAASGELSLIDTLVSGADVSIVADRIDIGAGAGVYADDNGTGVATLRADVVDNRGLLQADTLQVVAGTALVNRADPLAVRPGTIVATTLAAETPLFDNRSGIVSTRSGVDDGLQGTGIEWFDNRGGVLLLDGANQLLDLAIDNSGGQIRHTGAGTLTVAGTHGLLNDGGEISGTSTVLIQPGGEWHNEAGLLHADDLLHLWLPEIVGIPGGTLSAGRELRLQSGGDITLTNVDYVAPSSLGLVAAGSVTLSGATIGADDSLGVAAADMAVSTGSVLFAGGALDITLNGDLRNEGLLFAAGDLSVRGAHEIHNGTEAMAGALVAANGDITLQADGAIFNNGSLIDAIAGDIFIGSAEQPVPVFENRRTGLEVGIDAWTHYDWSSFHGNDGWFPDDAWWIEHCYHRYGGCGYPDLVDLAVDEENARIETENQARAAHGLPPLPLIDYKAFDPADYVGVTQYLDDNLGYDDTGWRRDSWIYVGDHENRRYVRREDLVTRDVLQSTGRAAELLAGNDITIHAGHVLNENSLVSAGADVSITADAFANISRTLTETTVSNWWAHGYMCDSDDCWLFGMVPEGYPPTATLIEVIGAIPSVVEAGGSLSITGWDVQNVGSYTDVGWRPSGFFDGPPAGTYPVAPGLPPDVFALPADGSLFRINDGPGHRYLVETNPVLATYAGFLGSDYLLGRLGLDPDATTQRLGDAYYEMTLVRESLLALTGSRFLPYAYGDEQAQFAWLLENGVYAAHRLQLSVGVALTAEQVNALTADIVWLEERLVAGHTVLVPVVYLAPASAEVSVTGALLAASQVAIDAVALENSGTVAAQSALDLRIDTTLTNEGGVLSSNGSLLAIAGGEIGNYSGTIRGQDDVALVSTGGHVVNETVTRVQAHTLPDGSTYDTQLGRQARIAAGDTLSLLAAGDVVIAGARVEGGAAELQAGGDVTVSGVGWGAGGSWQNGNWVDDHVRQLQASISALTDVLVSAEQDVALAGASLAANRDVALYAGNDLLVAATSESDYSYRHWEKETSSGHAYATDLEERASVLGSVISAGGNLEARASNIQLVASRLAAEGRIDLQAAGTVALLSAMETAYALHDSKRNGEFGREVATHDETSRANTVASDLQAGGAITITGHGDQVYQAASLASGADITLASDAGNIQFSAAYDTARSVYEHTDGDLAWRASEGHGVVDETARLTEIVAAGQLAIEAANGLTIDIRQVDQQTISEAIDALSAANPRLAWLKEAKARGDVDWRQVQEVHDAWQYDHQSLGEGAALAIAIVVTALTDGAGAEWVSNLLAPVATEGGVAAAANAVYTGIVTDLSIGTINNGGNLGEAVSALDSQESVQRLAASATTAGITKGFTDERWGGSSDPALRVTRGFDLSVPTQAYSFVGHEVEQILARATVDALVFGGSFEEYLRSSAELHGADLLAAFAFDAVGDYALNAETEAALNADIDRVQRWAESGYGRTALHAVVGGAVSEITGGDFATGAAAAGLNQALAATISDMAGNEGGDQAWNSAAARLAGLTGAALVNGDVNDGAWIALQADTYNRQLHTSEFDLIVRNVDAYAKSRGISSEQAFRELTIAALIRVDEAYANDSKLALVADSYRLNLDKADAYLSSLSRNAGLVTHSDGQKTRFFTATPDQYRNAFINSAHLLQIEDGELFPRFGKFPIRKGMAYAPAGEYEEVLERARLKASTEMAWAPLKALGMVPAGVLGTVLVSESVPFLLARPLLTTELTVEAPMIVTEAMPAGVGVPYVASKAVGLIEEIASRGITRSSTNVAPESIINAADDYAPMGLTPPPRAAEAVGDVPIEAAYARLDDISRFGIRSSDEYALDFDDWIEAPDSYVIASPLLESGERLIDHALFLGNSATNSARAELIAESRVQALYLSEKYGGLTFEQRMARIDDLSLSNYMRIAARDIGAQPAVYRYLTEAGYQSALRRGSVGGYATTQFSDHSDEIMSGAQIAEQWPGRPFTGAAKYRVEIPTDKLTGFAIVRPFGGAGKIGWEYRANSYPEYGQGGWTQFTINPVSLSDVVIKEIP